jgi:hypothetical protein
MTFVRTAPRLGRWHLIFGRELRLILGLVRLRSSGLILFFDWHVLKLATERRLGSPLQYVAGR